VKVISPLLLLLHNIMSTPLWLNIGHHIEAVSQRPFIIRDRRSVGGGSINQAYCVSDGEQRYFVKLNHAEKVGMFEAEALGLKDLEATQTITVPHPLCVGRTEEYSYIVLEWLDLGRSGADWQLMGVQLAELHRQGTAPAFGWHRANTIGDTPQPNPWENNWTTFFTEQRLRFQFTLAQRNSGRFFQVDKLSAAIPELLKGHEPSPALVHGDLWSGNAAFTTTGQPVILDPATYYGDREVDIAMTELFGGFPTAFYQGYQSTWPLPAGYEDRKILYNLYHILNHFNLFGDSYHAQAQQMIQVILRA
jgi:fructosamine-3-kinase